MTWTEIIVLSITGLVAGLLSGTLGVGGGIIVIPVLVFILGMTQHQAQGTSLAYMLPPIGVLAVLNYYKNGQVNLKYALILVVTFVIGGYFGSLIAEQLPDKVLKKSFGVFVLLIGFKMIFSK